MNRPDLFATLLFALVTGVVACGGEADSTTGGGDAGADAHLAGDAGDAGDADGAADGPSSCAEAHGVIGCCMGDVLHWATAGSPPRSRDCAALGRVCGWSSGVGLYDCVPGPAAVDPSGGAPLGCGWPAVAHDGCAPCVADADCPRATPWCDVATGACIECRAAGDCIMSAYEPVCDTSAHACVECLVDADCKRKNAPACDGGRCVMCVDDAGCAASPNGTVCRSGQCGCASADDCPSGATGRACLGTPGSCGCRSDADCPVQSLCLSGGCLPRCTSNVDCWERDQNTPVCDVTTGLCGPCAATVDCAGNPYGATCDPPGSTYSCGCSDDADCGAPTAPVCLAEPGFCGCRTSTDCASGRVCESARCVPACATDADCSLGLREGSICETATGSCRGCVTSADCTAPATPVCIAAGFYHCAECASDADCDGDARGPRCRFERCGCQSDADCPADAACLRDAGRCGPRHCRQDADCAPWGLGCDPETARCFFTL